MHYPSCFRTWMGASGFEVQISGRRKEVLLTALDRLFRDGPRSGDATIRVGASTLQLDLANPSERLLYYAAPNLLRSYRKSHLHSILALLATPSRLFVDIGANLGLYSLLARTLGYQTLLFEPEPMHSTFLKRNREAIGTSVACALSDRCGTAEFFVSSQSNPGSSSLVMPGNGWSDSEYESSTCVRLATFDSVLSELGISPASIGLIKIDVEGNENKYRTWYAGVPDGSVLRSDLV